MTASYLVRVDDCCPTMNWAVWRSVEKIFLDLDVKPILAVVPDNQDATLQVAEENKNFWEEVRTWQGRGWTIGLHGYQHKYVTQDSGMLRMAPRSEFSGLPYAEQRRKLECGMEIFRRERVNADVWVAPGHTFDETTLQVLSELGLRNVSDGHFLYPQTDARGMIWLPQQLWRFQKMPVGLWTICLHLNRWTELDIAQFATRLRNFRHAVTDVPSALASAAQENKATINSLFHFAYQIVLRNRSWLLGGQGAG